MAEPIEEVRAVMTVLLDAFPESPSYPIDQAPDVVDPYQMVADSTDLWPVVKLELLRQAIRGEAILDETMKLARSLTTDHDDDTARLLITEIESSLDAPDPLGRVALTGPVRSSLHSLLPDLVPAVHQNMMMVSPDCEAELIDVGGRPVMSIYAAITSTYPVTAFRDIIDPKRWVDCAFTNQFFRKMDPQTTPDQKLHPPPDVGYRETITEVVDFSLGLEIPDAMMTTDLEIVVIDDTTRPDLSPALSATYDLASSHDGKIVFDRGYLTAEADTLTGQTNVQTLKQVWFAEFSLPDQVICPVWSLMTLMLTFYCVTP